MYTRAWLKEESFSFGVTVLALGDAAHGVIGAIPGVVGEEPPARQRRGREVPAAQLRQVAAVERLRGAEIVSEKDVATESLSRKHTANALLSRDGQMA